MLLVSPSMSFGFLMNVLQRRDHHRRREVGAGVAVEELRDLSWRRRRTRRPSSAARCSRSVSASVLAAIDGRVGLDVACPPPRACRGSRGTPSPPSSFLRLARHHEAVDRGLDGVGADRRVDLREREEVEVVLVVALRELLADEHAQDVHAGLLLLQRLGGLLPGAARASRAGGRAAAASRCRRPS